MLNVTKELTALARKLGYTGKAPDTVAKAINAITSVAGEGSGGCDCEPGYEKVETQLFSETVTTSQLEGEPLSVATLTYASLIEAPSLTVTFDNSTYTLPLNIFDGMYVYGEFESEVPVFSTYPFFITSEPNLENPNEISNSIYTETEGTHNLTVSTFAIETSEDFDKAVVSSCLILTKEAYNSEIHDTLIGEELLNLVKDNVFGGVNISYVLIGATSKEIFNAFPNVVCEKTSNDSTTLISLPDISYTSSPNGRIYRIEVDHQAFVGLFNSIMIAIDGK